MAGHRCAVTPRQGEIIAGRVAVVFYGLSRNLTAFLPSFERHIFSVLKSSNISYDIVWNTMALAELSNPTSGEENAPIDEFDGRHLRPCIVGLQNQAVVEAREVRGGLIVCAGRF